MNIILLKSTMDHLKEGVILYADYDFQLCCHSAGA